MPERRSRKTGTSRKGKKRPSVETRLKTTAHEGEALEKSQSFFETVMSTMREPLLVLDADFRVVSANRALYETYGVKRENVEGKVLFELGDKAWDLPLVRERLNEVLTEDKVFDGFLVEYDFPAVGQRVLLVNASPMIEESGQSSRIVLTFNDITELRKADEEIESLSRFPSENPNVVMRISKDGNIMYSNRAGLAILDEWKCQVGQPVPSQWGQLIADVFEARMKREVEEEHGGQTFLLTFAPIVEADYVNVYGRDITGRKKAEEELRNNEALLRSFFDSPGIMRGIVEVVNDVDVRHIRDNEVTARYIGLASADLQGKLSSELGEPSERTKVWLEHYKKCQLSGQPVRFEYLDRQGSKESWLVATVSYLGTSSSGHPRFVYVVLDDTERKKAEEQVRQLLDSVQQEKDRLSSLVNSMPDEVWFADKNRKFTLANPSAVAEFGLVSSSDTDVEKLALSLEIYRPDGSKRSLDEAPPLRALKGEVVKSQEEIIKTPATGELRYRQVNAAPVRDSNGNIVGSVSVVRDITELKKAEAELRKARDELEMRVEERTKELNSATETVKAERQRFTDVLEKLPAYLILLTPDHHVSYANRFFRERFGENSHNKRCYEYLFNRSEPCEPCETYKTLEKKVPLEWEWTGPDGHIYYIYDSPFTDIDGSNLIMEVGIDITERKKAEEAVRKAHDELENRVEERTKELKQSAWELQAEVSERKKAEENLLETRNYLENLIDYANAPIVVWNREYRITRLNRAFERLTGLEADDVLGKPLEILFPEDSKDESLKQIYQTASGAYWETVEIPILRVDGALRTVLWNSANVLAKDGVTVVATIAQGQDITERKKMQAKLEEYSQHLEQLVEQKTQELKDAQRLATIGETASMVGHDIRNPLQSIEGALYLAREETKALPDESPGKKELQEVLEIMRHQTNYIDHIVADLQDFSRTPMLQVRETDLHELVTEALLTTEIPENVEVQTLMQDDLKTVRGDPVFIKRILLNLVENAVHAMPQGGKLAIRAFIEDGCTVMHVEDTGVGISEENKPKMFIPLFTTKSKGQGFGLAVCKKLVEAHNGEITFESELGRGTIFKIKLPQNREVGQK